MHGEGKRRFGETPAAFGAHVAVNLGVLEILDSAGAGELIDIGGDPQQHFCDVTDVDDDVAALGVVCFGAQVDDRRVLAELKLGQPGRAVAQPLDLITESLGDQLAPGELVVAAAVGVLWCGPTVQRAQLPQRSVQTVEVGVADDRVYPCRAEPGRSGDLS